MRKNIVYWLGFLWILGLLPSCEEPENIGSNLRPGELVVQTHYVDTFEMGASTIQLDSVSTLNLSRMLFGSFEHPYFGKATATTYTQMLPPSNVAVSLVPPDVTAEGILYDSVSMGMLFNYFHGEDAQPGTSRIQIYELEQGIDTTANESFYSDDSLPIGQLLGDSSITFEEETTFTRIRLSQQFGQNLFDKVRSGDLNNRTAFAEEFDGIAIKTDGNSNAMFGANPSDGNTNLRLHYRYVLADDETGELDTLRTSIALFAGVRFHGMEVERTGTPLEGLSTEASIPSEELGNLAATQSGTGVAIYLKFPDELQEFGIAKRRVIDRAELWITPPKGSINLQSPPPSSLFFTKANASGNGFIYDENGLPVFALGNTSTLSATYQSGGQTYGITDITRYISDLVEGDEPNNGLILDPRDQASSTINSVLINGPNSDNEFPMKLRIYYTEFE